MTDCALQAESLKIVQLDPQKYKGCELVFQYETDDYYEVTRTPGEFFSIRLDRKAFAETQKKDFDGHFFEDHLEAPSVFSLYASEQVASYIEVDRETWHGRLRVSELLVMEPFRGKGFCRMLMNKAKSITESEGFIEIVSETQSCNTRAIDFYIRQGFFVNGIDLSHYTNADMAKHDVRIEMIYRREIQAYGIN